VTTSPVRPTRPWRQLLPLALIFIAVGLSVSFVGPFMALFLSEGVHAGPLKVTAFMITTPVAGVAVSWLVGRLSDRRPIRRRLLIVGALAGVVATALTAVVRDYRLLLVLTITLYALAGTLFPQSFAYARQVLQRGDPARAAMGISTLRMLFSVAWVGGPPLAAFLLADRGFAGTYAAAAAMYAVAAVVAITWLREVPAAASLADGDSPAPTPAPPPSRSVIFLIIAGFTFVQTSMVLGVQAMPLYVSTDLGGSVRDAGLILGLCAALEIPLMLGFGALSTRVPLRRLILLGVSCAIAYQSIATLAAGVWMLAAGQVLNAIVIATVSGLGISYVQDLLPDYPGRATTMIANTYPIGSIIAAPLFGLSQHFGYRLAYGLNVGLCLVGLILLLSTRGSRRAAPAPHPGPRR
jgi:MFS transporter, SET family, sugar efflux transporter